MVTATITPTVSVSKYPSMHSVDCILADLNHCDLNQPVSFPEYGKDLIEKRLSCSDTEEDDEEEDDQDRLGSLKRSRRRFGSLPQQLSHASRSLSWEENWLFCQKKNMAKSALMRSSAAVLYHEPVSMLVPNPNEDQEQHRAMIGEQDVDELSELSERQSVTSSLEYSSSSSSASSCSDQESVDEEDCRQQEYDLIEAEKNFASLEFGQQQDLEHTEYSVLPLRRPSVSSSTKVIQSDTLRKTKSYADGMDGGIEREVRFLKVPQSVVIHTGKRVTFKCVVQGAKPIGEILLIYAFSLCRYDERSKDSFYIYLSLVFFFDTEPSFEAWETHRYLKNRLSIVRARGGVY